MSTLAERVQAALVDAGYPAADVQTDHHNAVQVVMGSAGSPPLEAIWQAFRDVGSLRACWPCWRDGKRPCAHDIDAPERPSLRVVR